MGWTLFFMLVILKIPLAAALYLVWWAVKEEPATEEGPSDSERRPRRRPPSLPRFPRRGPSGGGAACRTAPCPQVSERSLDSPAPAYARRTSA
jgi:hypothetical protein